MSEVYAGKGAASRSKVRRRERVAVQRGARGRKLRIDGTFASYYVPGEVTTGSVWDALVAPILLLPPNRRRSVLILGLGGGSAARLVRALAPRARIVGVERDPEVVKAARRWFDLDDLRVRVVLADAQSYLRRARGRFDLVLEDVFVGQGRNVHKPEWFPSPGLDLAARRVAHGGLLVSNAIDEAPAMARHLADLFPASLQIDVMGYDNRILVGGPPLLSGRVLRSAVNASPVLADTVSSLRFRKLRGSSSS
ncbi:methyltransferase domain-containing protein [Myxococcota bacterium]|nr:methyltransferase domain-containing protein [Myxococcota bacterium]